MDLGSKEKFIKEVKAFKDTFASDSGKEVLERLSTVCHFKRSMFDEENVALLPFREGQRNVFLFIQYMLTYDTTAMMSEENKTVEY